MEQPRMNTELLPIIDHLQAMVATLEGLTTILRKMAARPWPEVPNGEGVAGDALAGEPSAGILPAGSVCNCGHGIHTHEKGTGWCHLERCDCGKFRETLTDPRD